mgnify:FL=1
MNKQKNTTCKAMSKEFSGHKSKDVIFKNFWQSNEHFADLFNAVLFNGRQLIKPDELTEMDTDVSATISSKNYNESITRSRDVVKKMYDGVEFNILGLEIQDKTHYAMPLRTMTYDALGYIKEYNNIKSQHKLNNDHFNSPEGFLSGINKDDHFHPIITLVFYYGETPWDGPMHLSDMMIPMSIDIKKYFSDYRLNLVQILDSDKFPFYNKDVKNLFDLIRYIYNKEFDLIYDYQSDDIDYDVVELISVITDNAELLNLYNEQIELNKGGNIMCNAFKELEAQLITQGKEQGRIEGLEQATQQAIIAMLEFGVTKEQILSKYTKEELDRAEAALMRE